MKKRIIRALILGFTLCSLAACQTGGNSGTNSQGSSSDINSSSSVISSSVHTHTPDEPERINVVNATCLSDGSYDSITYCATCRQELSREHVVIPATGHDLVHHDGQPATCTEAGWSEYDTCKNCDYTTYKSIPATGHVDIVTREENRVEPTCTENGKYDLVYYCIHDGLIYKTVHKIIPATGHTFVHHDGQPATCTEAGYKAYDVCSVCGYSTYERIPATGHVNLATRQDNLIEATCETAGSYDLVTYCQDDDVVISSEHVDVPALGHDLIHHDGQEPTTTEPGWKPYDTCSRCSYTTYEEIPAISGLVPKSATIIYEDYVKHNVYSISATPSKGNAKILVVPIWFEQSSNYILPANRENIREDIQTAYFGTNQETGWRSVKTYYEEESHNALKMTGTVSEWYEGPSETTKLQLSDYASESGGASQTAALAETVTTWYFKNHTDESRKDYDGDGDGYIDGVMLIYGAPDHRASGAYNSGNLWAYTYWVGNAGLKDTNNPGPNAYFWASYDFMYSSNKSYARTGKTNYSGGDTSRVNVDTHTFIHEMGHMFGLNDYYDYSSYGYSPAAGFSMQDENVGGHDPFSSFALGWGKAYIPEESVTINLKPFTQSGEMIILTPSWNPFNSAFDEYLVIEYYTPDGLNEMDSRYSYNNYYPKGSSEPGIRLWHVDARLTKYNGYYFSSNLTSNPNSASYGVTLAMTNTYDDGNHASYISPLGSSYANYNELQLIRNDINMTHMTRQNFSKNDLFKTNDEFTMEKYDDQFVKKGQFNSGKDLGFKFTVGTMNDNSVSVTIEKL